MNLNAILLQLVLSLLLKKLDNILLDEVLINNKPIKRVKSIRNLGLTFDEVLSWRKHVNNIIGSAITKFKDLNKLQKIFVCRPLWPLKIYEGSNAL